MSKGGSSTSVEIPDYIENAARNNLARADFVSKLGFVPQSFGPTVAAFTPMQMSAFGNTAQAADAFGLGAPTGADVFGGMGAPTTYADGIRAYSAAPLFNQTMADFAAARPGQFNAINSMFIDPFGYNPAGTFDMGELVNVNTGLPTNTTTTTTTTGGGGGGGGGPKPPGVIPPPAPPGTPPVPEVPKLPYTPPEFQPGFLPGIFGPDPTPPIVPLSEAQPGDAIAETDLDALNANLIGTGFEIPDVPGQRYQFYNPDIDYYGLADEYGKPYISPSTGQYVGTLEPSAEGLEAAQIAQEYLRSQSGAEGLTPMADDFYDGIRSASDFPVGLSTQGYDFSTYASPDNQNRTITATNDFGSTVSRGYGAGQVDPRLAQAAGYTNTPPSFLEGLLGSIPAGNNPVPVATQRGSERRETELAGLIQTVGGQNIIDRLGDDINLAPDQLGRLSKDFGTLTSTEVAEQASVEPSIDLTRSFKENRKILEAANADGNLGAVADAFIAKYGSNVSRFQFKTGIDTAILKDIQKIAAAKGSS